LVRIFAKYFSKFSTFPEFYSLEKLIVFVIKGKNEKWKMEKSFQFSLILSNKVV